MTTNTLLPGALTQLAVRVGHECFRSSTLGGVGERDDVLRVRRGLEPDDSAALITWPGDGGDDSRRRPGIQREGGDNEVGEALPRLEPGGASPPVYVMRRRASPGSGEASRTARHPSRIRSVSGSGSPMPRAERARRTRCRVERKRTTTRDAQGLEDAIAHREPVVEHRHRRGALVDQLAVDPHRRHGVTLRVAGPRSGPAPSPPPQVAPTSPSLWRAHGHELQFRLAPRDVSRWRADVAQLVEHHLAKVRVAGSNPVVRSEVPIGSRQVPRPGGVAEWHRQGPAKPCTRVRFPPPPRRPAGARGAISSVGEHYLDTVGVTGSIPVSATRGTNRTQPHIRRNGRGSLWTRWFVHHFRIVSSRSAITLSSVS